MIELTSLGRDRIREWVGLFSKPNPSPGRVTVMGLHLAIVA
jgi:hypothetical protein